MATKQTTEVEILRPDVQTIECVIIGDSRLVMHRWSEKARREMLEKQMGKARLKKQPKDPEADFKSSLYQHEDGWYGMPVTAFKGALVGACRYCEGISMVQARGLLFVEADGADPEGVDLVRVEGDGPHMREDIVRISMGTPDLRYRGEFRTWFARLRIRFNGNMLNTSQVFNLLNLAGLHVGIGEGRPGAPKTSMDWGMFHLATEKEMPKKGRTRK